MFHKYFLKAFVCGLVAVAPVKAFADWTPLVTSAMFDGVSADTITAATSILGLMVVVVAVGILVTVFVRH